MAGELSHDGRHGGRRARRGFALVLVLLVLVLAGTALAASARRSCNRALAAVDATEQVQLTWAVLSARAVGLAGTETWLAADAEAAEAPVAVARRTVTLGGFELCLVAGDEQAKANVNLLSARGGSGNQGGPGGDADLADALRGLLGRERRALLVQLRPQTPREGVISALARRYESFDQVFAAAEPSALVDAVGGDPCPTDRMTCWGNGRVNVRRAGREVMRHALAGLVTETELDVLCRLRLERPGCAADEMLAALELPDARLRPLAKAVTDASSCHSLWIVVRAAGAAGETESDRGPSRAWHRLYVVQQGDAENDAGEWTFRW